MNATKKKLGSAYDAFKEERRRISAETSREGREIAPMPAVADPARRVAGSRSLRLFCETYFREIFYLAWSRDHIRAIAKIERAVLDGGLFAHAMPRGSGKTGLAEIACVWAAINGFRKYICLIGATAETAEAMLESIKTSLESNDLLAGDYPEVVYPINRLERIHNRTAGQTYNGEPTRIAFTQGRIVLPTVAASQASGAIITVTGLAGQGIRGQKHKLSDGRLVRPDLVLVDDPQTTESAWSPIQNARREALLAGDVLGMAGPGKKIAAVLCCTVIRPGDMADALLDRDKHPDWQGERTKMVYSFPTNTKAWDQYFRLRADSLKRDSDGTEATEFYRAHQGRPDCQASYASARECATCPRASDVGDGIGCMDAGSVIAWPDRKNPDEASCLQHAMNLKSRDEAAFFAEYQNEPLAAEEGDLTIVTASDITERITGGAAGIVPRAASRLTTFVDVHDRLLYHMTIAWADDFTGTIIEYGTWPDQHRGLFTLRDARATLGRKYPGKGKDAAILAGLVEFLTAHMAREWPREDGTVVQIAQGLVDSGYVSEIVYAAIRRTGRLATLAPSKGVAVGPDAKPWSQYVKKPGERYGLHWRVPSHRGTRELATIHIDTHFWKTFCSDRLTTAPGDPGALMLYGTAPTAHRLISEHLAAESRTRTSGRGRTVDVWRIRASSLDNHWLDCLVGCAVAASMSGARLAGMDAPESGSGRGGPVGSRQKPMKLSSLQRNAR